MHSSRLAGFDGTGSAPAADIVAATREQLEYGWLTISLLQMGSSSRPGMWAKELHHLPVGDAVEDIGRRLFPNPVERRQELDRAREDAGRGLREAARLGFRILTQVDEAYPPQLLEIVDPPAVLWVKGEPEVLPRPAVAVVGSRDAQPVSLAVARKLSRELAEAGLVVVSGLARGVDGAAHLGALDGGGRTVAILGSGLDVVYPAQHKPLADRVSQSGAVATELPPWAGGLRWHFPLRNRIISGLSRAVVVVEASEHSGSLITARMALEQHREVLAVPGNTLSGRNRGSNGLIKDGARLVETVEDVLEEIGWRRPAPLAGEAGCNTLPINALEEAMATGETYTIDDLAGRLGRMTSEILVDLNALEMSQRVTRSGGQFVRVSGTKPHRED